MYVGNYTVLILRLYYEFEIRAKFEICDASL